MGYFLRIFLFVVCCAAPSLSMANETTSAFIETQDGRRVELMLEIAATEAQRAQGLMFRQTMAANEGMVFIFENIEPRSFWMKNTYIPLDIIFLDANDRILSIGKGDALNEASVYSGGPAGHVIELNQGTALKLGIKPGDQVRFSKNFLDNIRLQEPS